MEKIILLFEMGLEKFSRIGLILCLVLILGFSVSSIFLRWAGVSPLWIEPLVRHLVFLSAFFGGSLATSKGVHIKIDVLTHLMERSSSRILHWLHRNSIALFCFIVTVSLTKASYDFYLVEKEFGSAAFLNIHSSWLVAIIPFGMGLISLRFLNRLILGLLQVGAREHHSL